MKCLSIQQPRVSLIACGIKDIENRTGRKLVPPQRILIECLKWEDTVFPVYYENEAGNEYVAATIHITVKRK